MGEDDVCVPSCPVHQFYSESKGCSECLESCAVCEEGETAGESVCIECRIPIEFEIGHAYEPNDDGACVKRECVGECDYCHTDKDGNEVCDACSPDYYPNYVTGVCESTACPPYLQYESKDDGCLSCPETCRRCDVNGCIECPNNHFLFTGEDDTTNCVQECPTGYREANGACVACSEGCTNCYTGTSLSTDLSFVETEICLECAEEDHDWNFLYLHNNLCVTECPAGWVGDGLLGWCVQCDCNCATCSGNKETCDSCHNNAEVIDGECIDQPLRQPFATFNDEWDGFSFVYPDAGYELLWRSNFTKNVEESLRTCHDALLNEDWSTEAFFSDLEAIQQRIPELLNEKELEVFNQKIESISDLPDFYNYNHDTEDLNIFKLFYTVSDSLFGRNRDDVISDQQDPSSIETSVKFNVEKLCNNIFDNDDNQLDVLLGKSRNCTFIPEMSCSLNDVTSGKEGCTYPFTYVRVGIDTETASFFSGMQLDTTDKWYRPIDGSEDSVANAAYEPITFRVAPSDTHLPIEGKMTLNGRIEGELPEANCESGVHIDWSESVGLCGINPLKVWIDAVFDLESNEPLSMSDA